MRVMLIAGAALCLGGCDSKPQVEERNASVEEVTNSVREATQEAGLIRAGQWVSTVEVEDVTVPGIPPQAAADMERMIEQSHKAQVCLTPEEAGRPNADFFGGNENCRYDHFTMRGGKIDAQMRCDTGAGATVMELDGTYARDSYTMRMSTRTPGGQGQPPVSIRMKVEAKRTGDCAGSADAAA